MAVSKKKVTKKKEKDFLDMTPLERALKSFDDYMTGAPTKYNIDYCNIAIEFLATGKSKEALAGHLGICKRTLYNWIEAHAEFMHAIKRGEALSQDWWESKGIQHITHSKDGIKLDSTNWIFNMKNRHGWTDKKEIDFGERTLPTIKLAYNLDEPHDED